MHASHTLQVHTYTQSCDIKFKYWHWSELLHDIGDEEWKFLSFPFF